MRAPSSLRQRCPWPPAAGAGWARGARADVSHRCLFPLSARSAVSIACRGHGSPSSGVSGARQACCLPLSPGGTACRQVGLLQGHKEKVLVEISTALGCGQLQGRGQVPAPQPFPGSAKAWAGGFRAPPTQLRAAVLFLKRVLVVCHGDNRVLVVVVVEVVAFPHSPALAGHGCACRERAGQGSQPQASLSRPLPQLLLLLSAWQRRNVSF